MQLFRKPIQYSSVYHVYDGLLATKVCEFNMTQTNEILFMKV